MTDRVRLKRLSRGRVSQDGEMVEFIIETTDGDSAAIECGVAEIGDIIAFLIHLADAAGHHRDHDEKSILQPRNYLTAIPARGFAFGSSPVPDEAMLVVRLAGFDLGFQVANMPIALVPNDLRRKADDLEQTIRRK